MQIQVTIDRLLTTNGFNFVKFQAGACYTVPAITGRELIRLGCAVKC